MDFGVLEFVPDAMVIVDATDGRISDVNEEAEHLFGYSRLELIGKPVEVLVPACFRARHHLHQEAYSGAPRRRPMGLGLELFGLTSKGEQFPAEISLSPMSVGEKMYTIAAVRDLTERKSIERQAELGRQAMEDLRRRDELISVASHALRGPIDTIQLGFAALRRATALSSEELRKVVEQMLSLQRQTRDLSQIVNELTDFSHIQLGRMQLDLETVDLAELAREVVDGMLDEVRRVGSQLRLQAVWPTIGRWDPVRLQQVITKLLLNAAKFGEGKPIDVRVKGNADRARLEVEDRGRGIGPEEQGRVFHLMELATAGGTTSGIRLSLYIARQIVRAHGGEILLHSVLGSGSTFTVDLPRAAAPDGAAQDGA